MAGFDYGRMAGVATRLLTRFNQGMIELLRETQGEPDPAEPWIIPAEPWRELFTLQGTVSAIAGDQANAQYIDGTLITRDDLVLTVAPTMTDYSLTDYVLLDGRMHAVKKVVQLPAAGVAVAFKLFISGAGSAAEGLNQPAFDFTYVNNIQYLGLIEEAAGGIATEPGDGLNFRDPFNSQYLPLLTEMH